MAPKFTVYTASDSPNGLKATLIFEELKAAYPNSVSDLEYEVRTVDINPSGRIPAVVHHRPDGTDFAVWEPTAILHYLIQRFDPEYKLSFPYQSEFESDSLQWTVFTHGGVAPVQGLVKYFFNNPEEKVPSAINRYLNETKRVYNILDTRLTGREYLAGPSKGTYSIADINVFPWVGIHEVVGIKNLDEYTNLKRWFDAISGRPAVEAATQSHPPKSK
ncbi:glutathione S-transferase [Clavulina sp. PMI_390]|nr:glutathione S-transferase [Clavulina sp. PMI_390]